MPRRVGTAQTRWLLLLNLESLSTLWGVNADVIAIDESETMELERRRVQGFVLHDCAHGRARPVAGRQLCPVGELEGAQGLSPGAHWGMVSLFCNVVKIMGLY
jgi:hypothetical protein